MRGIGTSLLGSASVVALVSGTLLLAPNQASAQIDIPGMMFGGMSHGFAGPQHYRGSRRGRVHESKHERRSPDRDAKEEEPSEHNTHANGKPAPQEYSAPAKDAPQTAASSVPSKSSGDEPTFSPSR